ncbi:MAG: hypothetical protein Q8Q89_00885 [bacterium]|nr:hypothetical protein [bacterium]
MLRITKFLKIFYFPRQDLENRWWHRMFKVLIIVGVMVLFLFSSRRANEIFKPYYIYSCQEDFDNYSGHIKDWRDIKPSYSDKEDLVFKCKYSKKPSRFSIGAFSDNDNSNYVAVIDKLEKEGALSNFQVKELLYNFYGPFYEIVFIIIVPMLVYLFAIHVIYRIIVYILVGKMSLKDNTK